MTLLQEPLPTLAAMPPRAEAAAPLVTTLVALADARDLILNRLPLQARRNLALSLIHI